VTKKEIAKAISEEAGVPLVVVTKAVQRVIDGIIEVLVSEGRIELRNFGVFMVRKRPARQARNPRTGEQVWVPERKVVTFKPGREMMKQVRSHKDL
jgi:integration host factor subunit beta